MNVFNKNAFVSTTWRNWIAAICQTELSTRLRFSEAYSNCLFMSNCGTRCDYHYYFSHVLFVLQIAYSAIQYVNITIIYNDIIKHCNH